MGLPESKAHKGVPRNNMGAKGYDREGQPKLSTALSSCLLEHLLCANPVQSSEDSAYIRPWGFCASVGDYSKVI